MRGLGWVALHSGLWALSTCLVLSACGPEGGADGGDSGGASCVGMANGASCGADRICVAESCIQSRCGDDFVDSSRGEVCDDGNEVAFDGCEPTTCQFTCTESSQCDDGIACNGVEECVGSHQCANGISLPDGMECALAGGGTGVCRSGDCVIPGCGDGLVTGDEHCDDGNDVETDGCRSDCRFTCEVDTSVTNTWHLDCDGDGFAGEGAPTQMACLEPTPMACGGGWTLRIPVPGTRDCDDGNASLSPGATEICDGVDQDCDGMTDEGAQTTFFRDADTDGHGDAANTTMACSAPSGFVASSDDCDDGDGEAFPGQAMFFTRQRTGGGFDFDCDGAQTAQFTTNSSAGAGGCGSCLCPAGFCCSGACAGWSGAIPACGASGTWRETDCDCNMVSTSRAQPCR